MRQSSETDLLEILRVLARHHVDFVIVGSVCAVLQGAPTRIFDLDIVHSRSPENLDHLESALAELDARYRIQPERALRPKRSHLEADGRQSLLTRFGPLDLLGAITRNLHYGELIESAAVFELDARLEVRALRLAKLIELKKLTGQEKDLAVLARSAANTEGTPVPAGPLLNL